VKHVHREVLEDFNVPQAPQRIVKVMAGRGNNLHEVVTDEGEKFLASMPTKFRKNVWVKRGDFVVVEPISEGDKVKAEIVSILYKEQIKYIKQEGHWPQSFLDKKAAGAGDDGEDDLFVNTNRVQVTYDESEDEESDEDESECSGDNSVCGSDEE